jgi:hypothetical protein
VRKPSPAMIVALLALFVALGGAGMAATGDNFILGQQNSADAPTELQGNVNGAQLRVTNSNAGGISVRGRRTATTGASPAVQGDTASTGGGATGVYGLANSASAAGDSNGVEGLNSGNGRGVYGQSTGGPGVYGNSTNQYGVWGIGSYGVVGGGTTGGVWASTGNAAGAGVFGQNTATGIGVEGLAPGGIGVHGYHRATIGTGPGVFGETNSTQTNSYGILAKANATNQNRDVAALRAINYNTNQYGMGVWGSIAGSGWGVLGEAGNNGVGVIGKLGGPGIGVYGLAGQAGVGVRGIGGKTGVFGQATDSGGYAFAAQGDAGQNRTAGGWVKAMAYIDPAQPAGQQVVRCFNSQLPSQDNCGILAGGSAVGVWDVNFGFSVEDRFVMVTPEKNPGLCGAYCGVATDVSLSGSTAEVELRRARDDHFTNTAFWIFIF